MGVLYISPEVVEACHRRVDFEYNRQDKVAPVEAIVPAHFAACWALQQFDISPEAVPAFANPAVGLIVRYFVGTARECPLSAKDCSFKFVRPDATYAAYAIRHKKSGWHMPTAESVKVMS